MVRRLKKTSDAVKRNPFTHWNIPLVKRYCKMICSSFWIAHEVKLGTLWFTSHWNWYYTSMLLFWYKVMLVGAFFIFFSLQCWFTLLLNKFFVSGIIPLRWWIISLLLCRQVLSAFLPDIFCSFICFCVVIP